MSYQLRSHSLIVGIINYNVFRFMVPLSSHMVLKEEPVNVRKVKKDIQAELFKITTHMFKLESKKLNDTEPPVSHLKLRVGKTSIKFGDKNNVIDSNIGKFYSVSIGGILGDKVVNNSNVKGVSSVFHW